MDQGLGEPVIWLERAFNLALIVIFGIWAYRFTRRARSGLLWRVSRKLILSYVLIGAVPILLLVTFSLLAFLLVFFDFSSYLVQTRLTTLTEQANALARATLVDIEGSPGGNPQEIARTRRVNMESRFPGASVIVIETEGEPRCGATPSRGLSGVQDRMPRWVACSGFRGFVRSGPGIIARAAALPAGPAPAYAVIVDLPVREALLSEALSASGISVGESRTPSLFNTATLVTLTDWPRGLTERTALAMSVDVPVLYRWLGGARDGGSPAGFNEILLYVLIGVGVLLLVIEIVALGNGLLLARSITGSVDELFSGTERVKVGDLHTRIAVRSRDQLGQLTASFNDMTARIQALLAEQGEKRRLEEELRIAREIQMSLLPQSPLSVPGLSVAALCVPAREVGGDYYDFLPLPDGRVGLLVADVAGKGTSAAFYMAELKGLMLSLSRIHSSPRELLIEANRIISQHLGEGSFITMTYAVVDPLKRMLTCARAGHTPFIRVPAGVGGERRASTLAPDGMVLGLNLDDGRRFESLLKEVTVPFDAGDLFFFFTDGISEAMDRQGDCFGESRLTAFLEANADLEPEAIRDRLVSELSAFADGQPQHDDITMMILKIDG